MDILWNSWVRCSWDHLEQRSRQLSWLLVSGNIDLWAAEWQVHQDFCTGLSSALSKHWGGYCWTNVSTSCLQPSIFRLRSNDDLQHHPERDRHDRVPQEDHQERRNPHQKTLQVIQRTYLKCNMRMPFFQNRSCVGVFQGQSFREAGKPEKRSEGYSETQVRATHHT